MRRRQGDDRGGFSSSLQLAQDFIAPAAICIQPPRLREVEPPESTTTQLGSGGVVGLHSYPSGRGVDDQSRAAHQAPTSSGALKVTLQDCLACSGCVTTAETVLVEAQSYKEVRRAIKGYCKQRVQAVYHRWASRASREEAHHGVAADEGATGTSWACWWQQSLSQSGELLNTMLATGEMPPLLFYISISRPSALSLSAYWGVSLAEAYEQVGGFMESQITCEVWRYANKYAQRCAQYGSSDTTTREEASSSEDEEGADNDGEGAQSARPAPLPASLTSLMRILGMAVVVSDLEWAQAFAREKVWEEYVARMQEAGAFTQQEGAPATPSGGGPRLPLIVSSCPGWCCYCEKRGGELLGLLSRVMAPQGIAGSYVKRAWAAAWKSYQLQQATTPQGDVPRSPEGGDASSCVYHISIQPCFDKKLEAARDILRESMNDEGSATAASTRPWSGKGAASPLLCTDCVLSTVEVAQRLEEVYPPAPAHRQEEGGGGSLSHHPGRRRLDTTFALSHIFPFLEGALVHPCSGSDIAASEEVENEPRTITCETARLLGSGGYHQHLLHRLWGRRRHASTSTTRVDGSKEPTLLSWIRSDHFAKSVVYVPQRNRNHQVVSLIENGDRGWDSSSPNGANERKRTCSGAEEDQATAVCPGRIILSSTFHVAYGFQHAQNVVRQLQKRGASTPASTKKKSNSSSSVTTTSSSSSLRDRLNKLRQQRPALVRVPEAGNENSSAVVRPTSFSTSISSSHRDPALPVDTTLSSCTFLEVMACPDGCLNGGGQVRGEAASSESADVNEAPTVTASLLQRVLEMAVATCSEFPSPSAHPHSTARHDTAGECYYFSLDGLRAAEKEPWGGQLIHYCTFKDRKAEYDRLINEGGAHSLQW